jgi:regulatory protein
MAVKPPRSPVQRPPLDAEALERCALHYAGRYATTRAKLAAYLERKLRRHGWAGDEDPAVDRLVEQMAGLGYVDDRAFASARAASLGRRGYGERRIGQAIAAMLRAGHGFDIARRILACAPGEIPDPNSD